MSACATCKYRGPDAPHVRSGFKAMGRVPDGDVDWFVCEYPLPQYAAGHNAAPVNGGQHCKTYELGSAFKCPKCRGKGEYYSGQSTVDGPWPCEKCNGSGRIADA